MSARNTPKPGLTPFLRAYKFKSVPAWLVHLGAIVCVSIWGLSFVSTKVLLDNDMGTVEVYVYRFVIAYLCMLVVSHKQLFSHTWRDEGLFVVCAITSGTLYFIAENTALEHTLVTNVSLLTSMSPLLTALLAGILYKDERPGRGLLIGSMIAFVGVAMVIFNANASLEIRPYGDMLALGAALCWAIYSLILRKLSANYDVYFITRKTFFYGVITAIPFMFMEPTIHNPIQLLCKQAVLVNVLFLGFGASLISFLLWSVTVKNLGAVKANDYMYFQSIITMIASYFILGEAITAIGILGCLTIIGGLWLGAWLTRRHNMAMHR